ncbi:DUF7689 domain-containing protein [Flagellimonas olearia]|uniref:DUF7689 domain-containing protein n=1 Tax=Flagellimonas olearia TaxID=552546 RepID=A0A444VI51_9FLAO|nr:hypothetical protein [Allomuricauda olearia]RYC50439.1 hypothetical protein DN53_05850 [Allomuricauda olearia]
MAQKNLHNENIFKAFPLLKNDPGYRIKDDASPDYNCIAWAANKSDLWYQPLPEDNRPVIRLDGVVFDWPFGLPFSSDPKVLIKLFEFLNYTCCQDPIYEEGYKKVALYQKNNEFTHAARQLTYKNDKGIWSSKLGEGPLITHTDPYLIEGIAYGQVYQIMKKSML